MLACYVLTPAAVHSARKLRGCFQMDIYGPRLLAEQEGLLPFTRLSAVLRRTFRAYRGHIFFAAAGIVLRCLAPLLESKQRDPAVVVCDQHGHFAISLLSGHWGGANALAGEVAACLGATPVITTATDSDGITAPDTAARRIGARILDWKELRRVNAALARGEQVGLYDPCRALGLADDRRYLPLASPASRADTSDAVAAPCLRAGAPWVYAHWRAHAPEAGVVRMAVPALHLGIGCRRGTPGEVILKAFRELCAAYGLEPQSIAALASATIKADEAGVREAALRLGVPLRCYDVQTLAALPVQHPSAAAARLLGVANICVCEGAALASALHLPCVEGQHSDSEDIRGVVPTLSIRKETAAEGARLICAKQIWYGRLTLAVALPSCWQEQVSGI